VIAGDAILLDTSREIFLDGRHCAVESRRVLVEEKDLMPVRCCKLRDSAPHRARTDNANYGVTRQ
jgi:hypothetical protein